MRQRRWRAAAACLALLVAAAGQAAIIADYQGDWQPGTVNGQTRPTVLADGWDYMWNSGGAIGNGGNYSSLKWWSTSNHYNYDGAGSLPRSAPARYVNLNAGGGHPGQGSSQGAGVDRYAIAAYTVQAGEEGVLSLTNSSIAVPSGSGTVEVRVYVNDSLMSTLIRSGGGATSSFDRLLGYVNAGDRVFVAVGPNTTDGNDSFSLGFGLETGLDANTLVWDADGVAPINGGAGGWDTTNARWVTQSGAGVYTAWNNASGYTALFGPSSGNVSIDVPVTAQGLIFSADGYTLSGSNAVTLTNTGSGGLGAAVLSVLQATYTAAISAPLLAATNVTRLDAGTLTLLGSTSITGDLRLGGGNTVLAGNSTTNVSGNTRIGLSPASSGFPSTFSGTLTIQDNASLTTQYIYMGENSGNVAGLTAVVNQTGGTVTTSGVDSEGNGMRIGHWPSETSTYNLSGGTLTLLNNAELALAIDGNGIFNLSGTGVLNVNRFVVNARNANGTGTFTVTGGTANIGSGGIVNESTGPANVNLGGGTIRATSNFSSSLNMNLTGTNGNITFDTNGYTIALSGSLTGAGGLTKTGAGTLRLSGGGNAYAGTTAINGGLLDALCNFAGGVTIAAPGALHVAQGLFRQTDIGGNYTQDGTLYLEMGGATPGSLFDWLQVAGSATLGGTVDVNITASFAVTPGMYFDVLVANSGITNSDLSGVSFNFHGSALDCGLWALLVPLGGGAEALRLVASPEPGTLALLALGALGLWRRRRHH